MYLKRIASILAIALVAACGSDSGSSQTDDPKKPSVMSGAGDEASAIEQYFEALVSTDLQELQQVIDDAAAPDSIAQTYMKYRRALAQADVDAGQAGLNESDRDVDENADGYEFCETPLDGEEQCLQYADIETTDGKVSGFTINGVDISKQFTVGDGSPIFAGDLVEVTLVAGYQSVQSGAVFVVLDVKSKGEPVTLGTFSATYRNPDGRQKTAVGAVGASELSPDSLTTTYVVFEDAQFGGEVTFDVYEAEDFIKTETVRVPIQ